MTDSHFLNDLNDLDLNDRFFTFLRLPSMRIFLFLRCFCNKVLIENDRKYYLSTTYVIFGIESQGESLHSAQKMLYLCTGNRKNSLLCLARVFS